MMETTMVDGVTVVRVNRPPVNALDIDINDAITTTFATLSGPVVFTGTGRCFSAGVDLRAVLDGDATYAQRFLDSLVEVFLAVFDYPEPVVAAVNGHALAGGCVLAMASDVRLMSGGTIGITEIAVGVPFPVSAIEICRHVMGASSGIAALSGAAVTPDEALRRGWIDDVVDGDELIDAAIAQARTLGALSASVYAHTKMQLHRPARAAISAGVAEDAHAVASWSSDETRRRIAYFVAAL